MFYFQFEAEFIDSLQCIPMQVRMKLDTSGIKLKLVHWNHFNQAERQALVDMSCVTPTEVKTYQEFLQGLVISKTGKPAAKLSIDSNPPWLNGTAVPEIVQIKAQSCGFDISLEQWSNLNPAQRFALIKLSRPSHENKNFVPALKEFQIVKN